ncbi:MAG: type 1 glutamine amidotransferase-like domain-containing protein [Armatimonadetes bacterium]|nr:type 1 glutamine amidotransferase-like domain-containing protein [Armatimonadota bacterium]NIM23167.1 type 1 glutamine amidotransferase-like domain-containing protein [Armatimonadota bacterium]NIM67035.1 type 1 glutamine amidotransferase-like domain-containing protein [Armatimonadota bacterium]NIM75569.1 type 1 glutamine amidotransferase-like domain-containing protein [Armatimonadota bacterium]NIN05224.1 type 1 glutamine amidotransferase-like domain-containing protein [Armatimonadota bacteri
MASTLLFLIGGTQDDILDTVADEFVAAAGGRDATTALLMIGGQGWERYLPRYLQPWEKRGATKYHLIVPRHDGFLDLPAATSDLRAASGIFIAGGQTSRYHQLYASEPIRSVIRQRCSDGVPFAGLSAGALLAPDVCLLRATPNTPNQALEVVEGLGLVSDLIVEVHFTEGPGTLPTLLDGMSRTKTRRGLGIGESACAVLDNGRLRRVVGSGVYEVTMTDFEAQRYEMTEVAPG